MDTSPKLRIAKERQDKINAVRPLAAAVAEIEQIAHDGATVEQLVKRLRNLAAMQDLVPIGAAGEKAIFDPALHRLQWGDPKPGIPVFVIKPGYAFRYRDEVIVIDHALVATD